MDGLAAFWAQADGVGRFVILLLLAMSVTAWVLIVWKTRVLRRAHTDITRAVPVFWDAPGLDSGRQRLAALDREQVLLPLLDAALAAPPERTSRDAPASRGPAEAQLTRRLRDALHRGLAHLQWGQVVLASIGSTAPFVGLFGTVWGVYGALIGMAEAGGIRIERVAGPIGEALVMTAAGIAVAVPAVIAFNAFGKRVAACEAELEGFAHELRAMVLGSSPTPAPAADADAGTGDTLATAAAAQRVVPGTAISEGGTG
jgi:biopolymer transport protein ExbB